MITLVRVSFFVCLISVAISNPCQSSPCMNGGKCFGNESSYICSCPDGLSGHRCEERITISKFIQVFFCCCKSIELWSYVQSGNKWDELLEHVMMIPESEARWCSTKTRDYCTINSILSSITRQFLRVLRILLIQFWTFLLSILFPFLVKLKSLFENKCIHVEP